MTAVHTSSRPPASLVAYNPQPSQNTAPVIEYRCLYTHDLRRKQKRWQDGFCNFHTFNKRLMLYDVSRNFIGDTHWQDAEPPTSGDEVSFEQSVVLVQIEDQIATSRTDLTPLFDRRPRGPTCDAAQQSPLRRTIVVREKPLPRVAPSSVASKHKSLSDMLAKPKARSDVAGQPSLTHVKGHGQKAWVEDDLRIAKRRRTNNVGQRIDFVPQASCLLSAAADISPPKPQQASKTTGMAVQGNPSYVDLTIECTSSDNLLPGEVAALGTAITSPATSPVPLRHHSTRSGTANHARDTHQRVPHRVGSNVVPERNSDLDVESHMRADKSIEQPILDKRKSSLESRALAKPLRLIRAAPRSMLLCARADAQSLDPDSVDQEGLVTSVLLANNMASDRRNKSRHHNQLPMTKCSQPRGHDAAKDPTISTVHEKLAHSKDTRLLSKPQPKTILPGLSQQTPDVISLAPRQMNKPSPTDGPLKGPAQRDAQVTMAADSDLSMTSRPFRRVRSENDACPNQAEEKEVDNVRSDAKRLLGMRPSLVMAIAEDSRSDATSAKRGKGRGLHRSGSETQAGNKPPSTEDTQNTMGLQNRRLLDKEPDKEIGPWTIEATDLFDWRPPDWAQRRILM